MHVYSPVFQGQLIEKKSRERGVSEGGGGKNHYIGLFIVWVQGRVEKNAKKSQKKNVKNIFFCLKQISKCDTCFYAHFSRAFQKYSF